jgi:NTE family protein
MIVHINPMERDEVPKTAPDILNRINEISFNSSLLDEMRAINFVTRLIEQDWLKDEYKNRLAPHPGAFGALPTRLCWIFRCPRNSTSAGRSSPICAIAGLEADRWLEANRDALGKKSTVDLESQYLGLPGPRRKDGSQTRDWPTLAESGSD